MTVRGTVPVLLCINDCHCVAPSGSKLWPSRREPAVNFHKPLGRLPWYRPPLGPRGPVLSARLFATITCTHQEGCHLLLRGCGAPADMYKVESLKIITNKVFELIILIFWIEKS